MDAEQTDMSNHSNDENEAKIDEIMNDANIENDENSTENMNESDINEKDNINMDDNNEINDNVITTNDNNNENDNNDNNNNNMEYKDEINERESIAEDIASKLYAMDAEMDKEIISNNNENENESDNYNNNLIDIINDMDDNDTIDNVNNVETTNNDKMNDTINHNDNELNNDNITESNHNEEETTDLTNDIENNNNINNNNNNNNNENIIDSEDEIGDLNNKNEISMDDNENKFEMNDNESYESSSTEKEISTNVAIIITEYIPNENKNNKNENSNSNHSKNLDVDDLMNENNNDNNDNNDNNESNEMEMNMNMNVNEENDTMPESENSEDNNKNKDNEENEENDYDSKRSEIDLNENVLTPGNDNIEMVETQELLISPIPTGSPHDVTTKEINFTMENNDNDNDNDSENNDNDNDNTEIENMDKQSDNNITDMDNNIINNEINTEKQEKDKENSMKKDKSQNEDNTNNNHISNNDNDDNESNASKNNNNNDNDNENDNENKNGIMTVDDVEEARLHGFITHEPKSSDGSTLGVTIDKENDNNDESISHGGDASASGDRSSLQSNNKIIENIANEIEDSHLRKTKIFGIFFINFICLISFSGIYLILYSFALDYVWSFKFIIAFTFFILNTMYLLSSLFYVYIQKSLTNDKQIDGLLNKIKITWILTEKLEIIKPAATHFADLATDIAVLIEFYNKSMYERDIGYNDSNFVNYTQLFWVTFGILLFNRIISSLVVYNYSKSIKNMFLQFFDLYLFKIVFITIKNDFKSPSPLQTYILYLESLLESGPQLLVTLYVTLGTWLFTDKPLSIAVIFCATVSLFNLINRSNDEDILLIQNIGFKSLNFRSLIRFNCMYVVRLMWRFCDISSGMLLLILFALVTSISTMVLYLCVCFTIILIYPTIRLYMDNNITLFLDDILLFNILIQTPIAHNRSKNGKIALYFGLLRNIAHLGLLFSVFYFDQMNKVYIMKFVFDSSKNSDKYPELIILYLICCSMFIVSLLFYTFHLITEFNIFYCFMCKKCDGYYNTSKQNILEKDLNKHKNNKPNCCNLKRFSMLSRAVTITTSTNNIIHSNNNNNNLIKNSKNKDAQEIMLTISTVSAQPALSENKDDLEGAINDTSDMESLGTGTGTGTGTNMNININMHSPSQQQDSTLKSYSMSTANSDNNNNNNNIINNNDNKDVSDNVESSVKINDIGDISDAGGSLNVLIKNNESDFMDNDNYDDYASNIDYTCDCLVGCGMTGMVSRTMIGCKNMNDINNIIKYEYSVSICDILNNELWINFDDPLKLIKFLLNEENRKCISNKWNLIIKEDSFGNFELFKNVWIGIFSNNKLSLKNEEYWKNLLEIGGFNKFKDTKKGRKESKKLMKIIFKYQSNPKLIALLIEKYNGYSNEKLIKYTKKHNKTNGKDLIITYLSSGLKTV